MADANPQPPSQVVVQAPAGGALVLRTVQQPTTLEPGMEPGKTYVTVLPGHTRPAFVRKKKTPIESGFGLTAIARALGPTPARQPKSVQKAPQEVRIYSAPATSQYFFAPPQPQSQPTFVPQPNQLLLPPPPPPEPSPIQPPISAKIVGRSNRQGDIILQHTCGSCNKFRSPSYHSRHPLALGEVPEPSICRKCIKEKTSSEESHDEDAKQQDSKTRDKRRREKKHRGGHSDRHIMSTESRSHSSNKEEIRVTRRTRSRDRSSSSTRDEIRLVRRVRSVGRSPKRLKRSRSRSMSGHRHRVSYGRDEERHRRRRQHSDEEIRYLERTHYVDHRSPRRRSRSVSRDWGSRRSVEYERPIQLHVDDTSHTRAFTTIERQTHYPQRAIEYVRDEDYVAYGMSRPRLRPRSESMLAQHTYFPHEQSEYFEPPRRLVSEQRRSTRRHENSIYEREEILEAVPVRPPSRSVRILRVSREESPPLSRRRDWEHERDENEEPRARLQRRVSFDNSPVRRLVDEPATLHRRRRRRHAPDMGHYLAHASSEEYNPPEHIEVSRVIPVHAPMPPVAPWNPQERYLTAGPHGVEHELLHRLKRTHISPSTGFAPLSIHRSSSRPPPLVRGRTQETFVDHRRSRSASYRPPYYRHATAGGTAHGPARYIHVSEDAAFYPDV